MVMASVVRRDRTWVERRRHTHGLLCVLVCVGLGLSCVSGKPTNVDNIAADNVVNMQANDQPVPVPPANEDGLPVVNQPRPIEIPTQGPLREEQVPSRQSDTTDHDHAEGDEEECEECEAAEMLELQAAERKRMEDAVKFQEAVTRNVHDARSRALAEQLKDKPFEAGNVEEMMHSGHHVHGKGHEEKEKVKATGVDLTGIVDQPKVKDDRKKGDPGTVDADDLMHFGAGEHDHGEAHKDKPVKVDKLPGAEGPDDLLAMSQRKREFGTNLDDLTAMGASEIHGRGGGKALKDVEQPDQETGQQDGDIGVNVERLVHGEEHVHDSHGEQEGGSHGKKITLNDIKALGLSEEALQGIDINKLMTDNDAEYQEWQKEMRTKQMEENQGQGSFWDQLNDLRQRYFGSEAKTKQVKDISKVNADELEWEQVEGGDVDTVHEGESPLEHDMEMWGSTFGKNDRRPYKEIRGGDL